MKHHRLAAAVFAAIIAAGLPAVSYATTAGGATDQTVQFTGIKLNGPTLIPLGEIGTFTIATSDGSAFTPPTGYTARVLITPMNRNLHQIIREIGQPINLDTQEVGTYVITLEVTQLSTGTTQPSTTKTIASKFVQVATPSIAAARIITMSGNTVVRTADVGYPLTLQAVAVPAWDRKVFPNITINGFWTLPNGTASKDEYLTYTPTDNDYAAQTLTFKYTAMVGTIASTQKTFEVKVPVTKYIWPNFKVTSAQDYKQAPITARLKVEPATLDDQKAMAGKVVTYKWPASSATNIQIIPNGFQATALITAGPAHYPITATVADNRGNVRQITTEIIAAEPAPIVTELKTVAVGRFNRAPIDYSLQAKYFMSHPKDRIVSYEMQMDGQAIYKSEESQQAKSTGGFVTIPAVPPKQVHIDKPGQHLFTLTVKSAYGAVGTTEASVLVAENQAPVCKSVTATLSPDKKALSARAVECKDNDGAIKSFAWFVNGQQIKNAAFTNLFYPIPAGGVPGSVTLRVTDDSGAYTDFDAPVI